MKTSLPLLDIEEQPELEENAEESPATPRVQPDRWWSSAAADSSSSTFGAPRRCTSPLRSITTRKSTSSTSTLLVLVERALKLTDSQ